MKGRVTSEFLKDKLKAVFEKFKPQLVFFFGSAYQGKTGPLSDIDLAVLWPKGINAPMIKSLELQQAVKEKLDEDKFEVGSLNGQNLSFCYSVIKDGECIFGRKEDQVAYETRILCEYLDFDYLAQEYNRNFDQRILGKSNG